MTIGRRLVELERRLSALEERPRGRVVIFETVDSDGEPVGGEVPESVLARVRDVAERDGVAILFWPPAR